MEPGETDMMINPSTQSLSSAVSIDDDELNMTRQSFVELTHRDRCQLHERGWLSLSIATENLDSFLTVMLELASSLGRVVGSKKTSRGIDVLRPVAADLATRPSLSRKYGLGEQPWHMDMAHKIVPARFVVMGMYDCHGDVAPTELLDARTFKESVTAADMHSEPFLFRCGPGSFYGTILSRVRDFVRFDPGCMEPVTGSGQALLYLLAEQGWPATYSHAWRADSILVIDNWKLLHRRGDAHAMRDRVLYRVSVSGG